MASKRPAAKASTKPSPKQSPAPAAKPTTKPVTKASGASRTPPDTGADAFMQSLTHPLKPEVEALRTAIKAAVPEFAEGVKWNAPSYSIRGEDRITFNLRAQDQVRLIFHRGAKPDASGGKVPRSLVADPAGLLQWAADDRAIASFASMAEIRARKADLADLIRRWIAATPPR